MIDESDPSRPRPESFRTALSRRAFGLAGTVTLALPVMSAPDRAGADPASPLATYTALLGRHVRASPDGVNRVDYRAWSASVPDLRALDTVVASLAAQTLSALPRPAQFCAWVNLYNAVTLQVVLERYPVRSIREIRPNPLAIGPWGQKRVTVEGRELSLDDIEHRILRRQWREPRVHYAVNCASIGCPNLMARAWRPATLEADLDAAARGFVNHPRGVRAAGPGRVRVSSIYHWFKEDFGGTDAGVLAHLSALAAPALAATLAGARIAGHDYDWSINAAAAG